MVCVNGQFFIRPKNKLKDSIEITVHNWFIYHLVTFIYPLFTFIWLCTRLNKQTIVSPTGICICSVMPFYWGRHSLQQFNWKIFTLLNLGGRAGKIDTSFFCKLSQLCNGLYTSKIKVSYGDTYPGPLYLWIYCPSTKATTIYFSVKIFDSECQWSILPKLTWKWLTRNTKLKKESSEYFFDLFLGFNFDFQVERTIVPQAAFALHI